MLSVSWFCKDYNQKRINFKPRADKFCGQAEARRLKNLKIEILKSRFKIPNPRLKFKNELKQASLNLISPLRAIKFHKFKSGAITIRAAEVEILLNPLDFKISPPQRA